MAPSNGRINGKRSFTGKHPLLPAVRPSIPLAQFAQKPAYGLVAWTFGRGSVIWRIWPAVLLHTCFACLVVFLDIEGYLSLSIPNVMLTVLGVVIGFVISYRAMSGYDRYWMGRTSWADVMRNSRTIGRLIWFHVPPRMSSKTAGEIASGQLNRTKQEMIKVMAEKRMALDLVAAFAIALKHHIRGEVGIYYEDLYDLVRPLHDHEHTVDQKAAAMAVSTALLPPSRAHRIASNPSMPTTSPTPPSSGAPSQIRTNLSEDRDPVIPAINAYGTFQPPKKASSASLRQLRRPPSTTSITSSHQPLQAARQEPEHTFTSKVSRDLIPFAGFFNTIRGWFSYRKHYESLPIAEDGSVSRGPFAIGASQRRKWRGPLQPRIGTYKHRPEIAASGENLPVEVLRCLSEWFSVLEDRNTVPGTSMGQLIGAISAMEETLSALERILTTPLPFVYAVHIRHTVWIYLFFLPFQLVHDFGYYSVAGVCIAAFIYLGFLAAGEEIEQPFGYDENDLDLDMFCQEIILMDIEHLKTSPCLNAYLEPRAFVRHRSMTLTELSVDSESDSSDSEEDSETEVPTTQRIQSPIDM